MRKSYRTAAGLLGATLIGTSLIASAFAQPSTNGPSGTGPEGSPPGVVSGSGRNPGTSTTTTGHGTSSKMIKKHESKKSPNKM
jgi:hypothetical protein